MSEGWIKTTCAYCGVGCGVEARPTASGKLEVRGDKSHPSNFGKLCTKGIALGETVSHQGRLISPKIRTGTEWQDVTWEQALSKTAQHFLDVIEEHGPDAVAFYVSGQLLTEDYYVANKLIKGFIGTANIDSNSRLCMASSVVGHKRAFGMDSVPVCYEDLESADVVVLVGSNLAWCHPVLFQRLRTAKQENPALKVIVIDPRRNETCDIADLHLAIAPGSDVKLFNGLLAFLAENNHLNHDFISSYTNDFEHALNNAQQEQQIAEVTGLCGEDIQEFFEAFANHQNVVTIYSQGVNQSTQGSDKVNSILNCHLATGKIGQVGCGPFSVTGQPNAMGGREVGALANTLAAHMEFNSQRDQELVASFWQTNNLASAPGLKAVEMFDAIDEGKIKAVWIMATNPVVSLPDSEKIKRALQKCPLVVVSDCIENTATSRFADVLLPAQGWSEKSGTVTNSERRISRQRRLLASPGLARPDWWIICQVAKRMGYGAAFDFNHEGDIFKEHAKLTTVGNANKQRDLNLIGLSNLTDREYHDLAPQQWPVYLKQIEVKHQRLFSDGDFYTPNRRANFIAVSHQPPKQTLSDEYPLVLNSGRSRDQWHTMTRTGLSVSLAEHATEPYVFIHPLTAASYNLHEGDIAKVSSAIHHCLAKVTLSETMRPGELFVPIHWNEMTASESKPCALIDPRTDSISGQPEFKFTPVTITPCKHQSFGLLLLREAVELPRDNYWSRQKVEGGYLYRLRSRCDLAAFNLMLEEATSNILGREMRTHSVDAQYVSKLNGEKVSAIYASGAQLSLLEKANELVARFNQVVEEGSEAGLFQL